MPPSLPSGIQVRPSIAAEGTVDADRDRESLLERLNQAVRLPEDFGGLPTVVRLLDRLTAVEPSRGDHV
ncbi:hypothetical protein [Streptomyces sp. NBC_00448]|uniref:hypothetical protein n=1 Tax=Streptomyces sp. NBC_00448 TaxID=2903652 RepID=UPI002E2435F8